MSLYGIKNKDDNEANFLEKNLTEIKKRNLEISKILFVFVAIVGVYNLFLSLDMVFFMLRDFAILRGFSSTMWSLFSHFLVVGVLSVFLLASCFTKDKKILIPNLIFCLIQLIGWLTATIEMTQYQYVENKLLLMRPDFIDYFPTLTLVPYQLRDYLLEGVSMEIVRIYHCSVEVLQLVFIAYIYKFGNKE